MEGGGYTMKINESATDRVIRVIVGAVLLAAWVFGGLSGTWAVVLGIIGAVLLVTGAVGFCAIYALLGMSTARKAKQRA